MKRLTLLAVVVLALAAFSAQAQVTFSRSGSLVAVHAGCFVFDLDKLDASIPQEPISLGSLGLVFLGNLHELTPEEQALCDGVTYVAPTVRWVVKDNPASSDNTRPVKIYNGDTGELEPSPYRVSGGTLCGDTYRKVIYVSRDNSPEYRDIDGQYPRIAVCIEREVDNPAGGLQ